MQCGVYFSHFCQLLFRIAQERQTSHSHTFLYPGSSRCTVELGCCCSSCASNFCDFFSGNCLIIQSHVFCFDNQTFRKLLVSLSLIGMPTLSPSTPPCPPTPYQSRIYFGIRVVCEMPIALLFYYVHLFTSLIIVHPLRLANVIVIAQF